MVRQTVLLTSIVVISLLAAACNPIPVVPAPTPTPTPSAREPLQMSLYDFASLLARFEPSSGADNGPNDSSQYEDVLLEIADCFGEDINWEAEQEGLTPGEVAALQWWSIAIATFSVVMEKTENPEDDWTPSFLSLLNEAHTYCIEIE